MKIRFLNIKKSSMAILSAYLFSQVAVASIVKTPENAAINKQNQQLLIISEITQGLAEVLADISITDAVPQAHKQLKHSVTEYHAAASLKETTDQLPEYKFKVVITE
jgi:hypothetical protein